MSKNGQNEQGKAMTAKEEAYLNAPLVIWLAASPILSFGSIVAVFGIQRAKVVRKWATSRGRGWKFRSSQINQDAFAFVGRVYMCPA